jgi:parallel beta-helix repeat protein
MRNRLSLTAFYVLLLLLAVQVSAKGLSAQTILTFPPTDDATVRENRPTRNLGANSALEVDASSTKDTLLRFDVSGVDTKPIANVTLRLFAIDSSPVGGDFFIMTDTSWSETTVTWNTAPPGDGGFLVALGAVSSGKWYELDVTPLVTADGPVSIRVSSTNSNGADYSSKENANGNAPELMVTLDENLPPDVIPPTAPGNLAATDIQATRVTLSWDVSTDNVGVSGYDIYRDGFLIDTVGGSTTTYQDITVFPETSYRYIVEAFDAAGNVSDPSNTLDVTTPVATLLTFDVMREGSTSTYHAVSRTTPSAFTGTLKFVVESAVEELKSDGTGNIFFEAGDFDLGSDHFELIDVTDVTFAGQGIDVTIIRNFTNEAADTEPFDCHRCDRLTIRNMTVSAGGSARTTSDALDFDGGDDMLIESIKITSSRARGIIFDGKDAVSSTGGTADRNVVRDCIITGVPGDGIQLLASNNNIIENCHISNVGQNGIRMHKSSSSASQPNKPSNDNIISGNLVENAGANGIAVTSGNRNLITGNTVLNSANADGIRILVSGDLLSCDDNIVEFNFATDNQAVKTQRYGLNIQSIYCNRTVVDSNDFSGNLVAEINDNGTNTIYHSSDTEPPTAPGNLTATDIQASSVTLSWDAATDNIAVAAYGIYRDAGLLDTVNGGTTSYQDTTVVSETTYMYEAVARDAAGNESVRSDPLFVITPVLPPVLTLTPTDDATVRERSPSSNFGTNSGLEVDASSVKDTLLRFNVSGIETTSVASVTLRLFAIDSSSVGGQFFIVTDTNWSENTVTWNSAPPGDGGFLGELDAVSSGMWYELDVTPLVMEDGPVSIRISSTNSNGADYSSKENANGNAPELIIELN